MTHLEIRPYMHDHYFEGKIILPSVEIMIALARALRGQYPGMKLKMTAAAQFGKMLILDPGARTLDIQIEALTVEDGIKASLSTAMKSKTGAMTRTLEHGAMTFVQTDILPEPSWSFRAARKLERGCINIPAVSIYRDLVPFGPAYQNISGDLSLSEEGGLAEISGGGGEADDSLLGSPFTLDATMHAACVWGQRFCEIVAFPIGFDRRTIYTPTKKGLSYAVRITPVRVQRELLSFDAWIFDGNDVICEEIRGLKMRDITGGHGKPPDWIREGTCRKSS